jgi:hypothetical protein
MINFSTFIKTDNPELNEEKEEKFEPYVVVSVTNKKYAVNGRGKFSDQNYKAFREDSDQSSDVPGTVLNKIIDARSKEGNHIDLDAFNKIVAGIKTFAHLGKSNAHRLGNAIVVKDEKGETVLVVRKGIPGVNPDSSKRGPLHPYRPSVYDV